METLHQKSLLLRSVNFIFGKFVGRRRLSSKCPKSVALVVLFVLAITTVGRSGTPRSCSHISEPGSHAHRDCCAVWPCSPGSRIAKACCHATPINDLTNKDGIRDWRRGLNRPRYRHVSLSPPFVDLPVDAGQTSDSGRPWTRPLPANNSRPQPLYKLHSLYLI